MYAEVVWVLVSLGTQVHPQIILDPDYLPDYLSVSYDYGLLYLDYQYFKQETKWYHSIVIKMYYTIFFF